MKNLKNESLTDSVIRKTIKRMIIPLIGGVTGFLIGFFLFGFLANYWFGVVQGGQRFLVALACGVVMGWFLAVSFAIIYARRVIKDLKEIEEGE